MLKKKSTIITILLILVAKVIIALNTYCKS